MKRYFNFCIGNILFNIKAFVIWALSAIFIISTGIYFGFGFPSTPAHFLCNGVGGLMILVCILALKYNRFQYYPLNDNEHVENARIQRLLEDIECSDTTILKADGFDKAIIGHGTYWNGIKNEVLVYDAGKCVQIIMERDGCDHTEALSDFETNVEGAWMGEGTPMFIWTD